ncbi:MAG: TatD family hydrolase [Prevotellaceae bacterium]|jgi:TatD DNase family protein|nr:TatD family hydrolase [Prevotellaceae bacterium]
MQAKYIDFHTHKPSESDVLSIMNLRIWENPIKTLFSCGLHPVDIVEISLDKAFEMLREIVNSPHCVALGEAGIDKRISASVELQQKVFEQQLMLADEANLPVIIHNVRSLTEILNSLKKTGFSNPFIFHGFTGKAETARQILKAGGYLSFGKSILNHQATRETFANVAADRFFLETDEADCSIYEIYSEAASLRKINLNELRGIVFENFVGAVTRY